jgi:hypothetical protein
MAFTFPRLFGVAVVGLLTASSATLVVSPARAFEGELKAKLSGQPGSSVRVHAWYSNAGDVRIDTSGKSPEGQMMRGSTIMPASGNNYYSISHNQKLIVEVPYEALRAPSGDVAGKGRDPNLEIEKLGTETVSGVKTEHVRVLDRDNNATIDLWMTPRYPPDLWTQAFRGRNLGLEMSDDERTKAMKRFGIEPGFAMKMQVRQPGRPPIEFLVEEVKRAKVSPDLFGLPPGYRRVKGAEKPPPRAADP